MIQLSEIEVRVLGALIEKQLSTPEYYPLTLNSLVTACNQKNNRDPVVEFDDKVVLRAVDRLRELKLAQMIHQATSRVPKYAHQIEAVFPLSQPELVLMCELLLRGPQTVGELRGHCRRLHEFASLEEVETLVQGLTARNEGQFVMQLPLQAGRKEPRFAQLLAGPPPAEAVVAAAPVERVRIDLQAENERLAKLEAEVTALRQELDALRAEFATFRGQFQ
jgi:uncharacterized protein YceH (UPF0502 family)